MPTIHHAPPKVSIIVPVYNQQRFIKKCLGSILQQAYKEIEIIVVNDGSTDKSLSIICKMAKSDARIIVIDKANGGVASARREGLKKVTGKYVMFVDSDDWLTPDAISSMVEIAEREDVDVVTGKMIRHYPLWERKSGYMPALETNRKITMPELFDKYYVSFFGINIYPVQMCAKLYKASIIFEAAKHVELFDNEVTHMGEDEYFTLRIFPYMASFYASDIYIYIYRFGGITSHYNAHLGELFCFGDKRLPLLDQYRYEKGYQPLFIEYKNVLRDYVAQQITYQKATQEEMMTWLTHELETRYLVERMRAYYLHHECPPSLLDIVEGNTLNIYQLSLARVQANHKRFLIKQALSRLQRIFFFLK